MLVPADRPEVLIPTIHLRGYFREEASPRAMTEHLRFAFTDEFHNEYDRWGNALATEIWRER
jgi:hypothetical protein